MPPVEVRLGSRPRAVEPRLRDAELLEGGLDENPSAEHGLALAGSVHDPRHGASMTIPAAR
jgi:hypothetical protein